ncbi:MAG: hypothetical protein SOW59_08460 [Corynebacterium sp.]|nr:hypothetical protein [Corynebacterium sp.]
MQCHSTPVATAGEIPAFFFVSAHGGAGASTLARLIAPAGDAGHCWPVCDENPFVYVVARAGVDSLDRAHDVLLAAPDEVTVLGVVMVKDSSDKPSRAVTNKVKVLKTITDVFTVPYLKGVRECTLEDLPSWEPSTPAPGRLRPRRTSIVHSISPVAGEMCRHFVDVFSPHNDNF